MGESRESYRKDFNAVSSKTGEETICTDLAFTTTHPPDVSQRSRIVAVCGITDYDNLADPQLDGWFFSDFYLFHYLFNPLHVRTSSQIWLTCVDPAHLVAKYGEYAYGDPRNERRIVLEEALLPDIRRAGNIRVVDRLVLLESFVKTVEEQAREAKKNDEHLMIFIFGHAQYGEYGVYIGGANPESDHSVLKVRRLREAIPRGLNTTLLLTSCYSGGWLVHPDVNYNHRLNVPGISASGPNEEILSWSMSDSVGRASGSTIAAAILSQLIDIEENENAEDDPSSHPTYIDFATSIYDKAITFDTFLKVQNVHFSAQDDDWEAHWKSRTGIPLAKLKERWECLRQIPPSGTKSTGGEHSLANRQTGSLQRDLHHFAVEYLNAKPGRNNVQSNHTLYARLNKFFKGDPASCTTETVQDLLNKVVYRLNMMADADEYVEAMGFKYPSCLGFSVEDHELSDSQNKSRHAALDYMFRVKLFPCMPYVDIPHFTKPENYLAIVLIENCKSEADMMLRVDRALFWKQVRDTTVLPHVQAGKIVNDHHVRAKLHACVSALRDIGHRIRVKTNLLTPSHRGYSAQNH